MGEHICTRGWGYYLHTCPARKAYNASGCVDNNGSGNPNNSQLCRDTTSTDFTANGSYKLCVTNTLSSSSTYLVGSLSLSSSSSPLAAALAGPSNKNKQYLFLLGVMMMMVASMVIVALVTLQKQKQQQQQQHRHHEYHDIITMEYCLCQLSLPTLTID